MNLRLRFLCGLFLLASIAPVYSQQDLTLWRVGDHETHQAEELPYGSQYYFFAEDDKDYVDGLWSLKNEGSEAITLELPLQFTTNSDAAFSIVSQPDKSVLQPNEEAHFTVRYNKSLDNGPAFLSIASSNANRNLVTMIDGGRDDCFCYCLTFGPELAGLDCEEQPPRIGRTIGINLPMEACDQNNQSTEEVVPAFDVCNIFEITDPCSCSNPMDANGNFADTLSITGLVPLSTYTLSGNNGIGSDDFSFLNDDGIEIMPGTEIGVSDSNGDLQFDFYRAPGTAVSILINGTPFVSSDTCPLPADCDTEPIPTMGEWGIIILFLALSIMGIAVIGQRKRRTVIS